jgi:nucleoid-associated protein YgaU
MTPPPDVRPTSAVPRAAQVATASVPPPQEPRGAFTRVRAGETLAAIAARVYGNEDAAEGLWMANRDLLEREDAPLHEGALLRTP